MENKSLKDMLSKQGRKNAEIAERLGWKFFVNRWYKDSKLIYFSREGGYNFCVHDYCMIEDIENQIKVQTSCEFMEICGNYSYYNSLISYMKELLVALKEEI